MPTTAKAQLAMDERVIDDAILVALLDERLRARDDMAEIRGVVKRADDAANAAIDRLDLSPGEAVRAGRYRITKTHVNGRAVTFQTAPSDRVRIALVEDE